jgi:RNA-directed DNA polymerase
MQMPDGTLLAREKGTPQGSPISPLLANLVMHYAFDTCMAREYPGCPFERYADDIVAHCDSKDQDGNLRAAIAERPQTLGLRLHPEKTKIAFCKDANRSGEAEHTSFDFLGYTFRARLARGGRGFFVSFAPAISTKAKKAVGLKVRPGTSTVAAGRTCPASQPRSILRCAAGSATNGAYYRSELYSLAWRID